MYSNARKGLNRQDISLLADIFDQQQVNEARKTFLMLAIESKDEELFNVLDKSTNEYEDKVLDFPSPFPSFSLSRQ